MRNAEGCVPYKCLGAWFFVQIEFIDLFAEGKGLPSLQNTNIVYSKLLDKLQFESNSTSGIE